MAACSAAMQTRRETSARVDAGRRRGPAGEMVHQTGPWCAVCRGRQVEWARVSMTSPVAMRRPLIADDLVS